MNVDPSESQEWLADYMRRIGDIQQRAEQTQEEIKNLRAQASSPDETVSVELAPGGRLEELHLTAQALELGPRRLADVIKQTVHAAHADAARQTQQAMEPLVGQSDAMEFLRDQLGVPEQDAEDQQHSASFPGDDNDDDGYESNRSVMG